MIICVYMMMMMMMMTIVVTFDNICLWKGHKMSLTNATNFVISFENSYDVCILLGSSNDEHYSHV